MLQQLMRIKIAEGKVKRVIRASFVWLYTCSQERKDANSKQYCNCNYVSYSATYEKLITAEVNKFFINILVMYLLLLLAILLSFLYLHCCLHSNVFSFAVFKIQSNQASLRLLIASLTKAQRDLQEQDYKLKKLLTAIYRLTQVSIQRLTINNWFIKIMDWFIDWGTQPKNDHMAEGHAGRKQFKMFHLF